jgi:hypothetical protein
MHTFYLGEYQIVNGASTKTRHQIILRGWRKVDPWKNHRRFVGFLVLAGGLFTGTVYSADIKIGYVDIQKAVNECNAGKEAKKTLTQEVEEFHGLIAEEQKDLQGMK